MLHRRDGAAEPRAKNRRPYGMCEAPKGHSLSFNLWFPLLLVILTNHLSFFDSAAIVEHPMERTNESLTFAEVPHGEDYFPESTSKRRAV